MDLSGPGPIAPIQRTSSNELVLRINQRIAAEVLRVSGEQILLSVQGIPVVARLTTPEQSAALGEHQLRQFIVRDVAGQVVTLQLVSQQGSPARPAQAGQDLVPGLLQQLGLADTPENNLLARAALSQQMVLTADLLGELRDALAAFPGWGAAEAQAAVSLRAAGLPVTQGSLALALGAHSPISADLSALLQQLRSFSPLPGEPAGLPQAVQNALELLSNLALHAGRPVPELQEGLEEAVSLLGRAVEYDLSWLAQGKAPPGKLVRQSLLDLATLRGMLDPSGHAALVKHLDSFLEGLRWTQFLNALPEQEPRNGQWARVDIPVHLPTRPNPPPDEPPGSARLRIAFDGDPEAPGIDAHATHLVLRVDLAPHEALEVGLSIAGQRAAVEVTATTQALCDLAQAELPGLSDGLDGLGYRLERSLCSVGTLPDHGQLGTGETHPAACRPVDVSI